MIDRKKFEVPADKLRYQCDLKKLGFKDTSKVAPLKDFVGQDRAIESLRFGLEIEAPGYNIFGTGISDTGKTSLIRKLLDEFVKEAKKRENVGLKDICFAHNSLNPDKPKVFVFEKGKGRAFQIEIEKTRRTLKKKISDTFQSDDYTKAREKLDMHFKPKLSGLGIKINRELEKRCFLLTENEEGRRLVAMSFKNPGQPMSNKEFKELPKDIKKKIRKNKRELLAILEKMRKESIKKQKQLKKARDEAIERLEQEIVKKIVEKVFAKLDYKEPEIREWLEYLKVFVLRNIDLFKQDEKANNFGSGMTKLIALPKKGNAKLHRMDKPEVESLLPFKINVILDTSKQDRPPVIFEDHPTFANLFGRIDKKATLGTYSTDHTQIRPGSLIAANNGYLVIKAMDIFRNAGGWGIWEKLKKTLSTGTLKLEDMFQYFGYGSSKSLNPDPIPINVKVIIIGEPFVYRALLEIDPDFLNTFKVKAEFDYEMNLGRESLENYVGFIARCCQEGKLLPFINGAVAKVVEYGAELADDQKKLSTQFGKIKDLIIEANYWAEKSKAKRVEVSHVQKAIQKKRRRINLIEEKYQEFIERGMYLIDTSGEKVGQVNGLTVHRMGDFEFGTPVKVSAKTWVGDEGIISIQREVKLAGPIHNTGLLDLTGFLGGRYGQDKPLTLTAQICLEQCYGGIEGDSATVSETLALISSLSGVPIDQSLAVTGSMNQDGEIQPVGGIKRKIEGFFDICQKKGLTGKQGIIIPKINLDNLVLGEDVIEAAENDKFHIYAVKTFDDVLEIAPTKPAKEVDRLINERFIAMNKVINEFKKPSNKKEDL